MSSTGQTPAHSRRAARFSPGLALWVVLALVCSLCSVFAVSAQRARAAVAFRAPISLPGRGTTGLDETRVTADDVTSDSALRWKGPGNVTLPHPRPAVAQMYTDDRGWVPAPRQNPDIFGLVTSISARWVDKAGGGRGIEVQADGRGGQIGGRYRGRVLAVRLPFSAIYGRRAPGVLGLFPNDFQVDNDPLTPRMNDATPPTVVASYSARDARTGTVAISLWAVNIDDNCLYEKATLPMQSVMDHLYGLNAIPAVYGSWQRRQPLNPDTRRCEGETRVGRDATGRVVLNTAVVGHTITQTTMVPDANGALQPGPTTTVDWQDLVFTGSVLGVASGVAFGLGNALLLEDAAGHLFRTVMDAAGHPTGGLVRLAAPELPPGAPPLPQGGSVTVEDWAGHDVVVDLTAQGVVVRDTTSNESFSMGKPNGTLTADQRPTLSVSPTGPGVVSSPGADLVITVRTSDGKTWQSEMTRSVVTRFSGWVRPLVDDPDFPVLSGVSAPVLSANESVQAWGVGPMLPGAPGGGWQQAGGNDTSDKTELLVVRTQTRILGLPLRADNRAPQSGAGWSAITPPGLPSSSDGQRLRLMWNGQREHQVVLDDSFGNVYVVPVYDASLGACRAGTDADCLQPGASTPGATMLSGKAAWTQASSASALGTLDRLVAPPGAVYESRPARWILQGVSRGGHEVQDVWTKDTGWTGWYASDLSPGSPPVQGNVAAGGRIVSAQRSFTDGGVSTVWARLDTLVNGRKSVEIHVGATAGANGPRPSGVYGFAVPTTMYDAAVPVLNADGSLTLFAPVVEGGKVYVKAARLDGVTGLLSDWTYLVSSTQVPKTLPDTGPRIGAVEIQEKQSCTATSCTQQASYSLVLRDGATNSPRVTSASGTWNTTGDPAFTMSMETRWMSDLGGEAVSAPAVSVVPSYPSSTFAAKLLVALNGRDGLYFEYVYVDATGAWKDSSGYSVAYDLPGTGAKIKKTVSPNIVLDEKRTPQIAVVDTNGQARVGWITDNTTCLGCPVIGPGLAEPAKWSWDLHADDIAGSTTDSLALLAPTKGVRQIVMTNPNNQAIDYSQDTGVAWQPTYTTNTVNATTTGNAPDTRGEWNDPHNDAL